MPDNPTCARHSLDCSVEKHADEWRSDALRLRTELDDMRAAFEQFATDSDEVIVGLRAAVANLTAERDLARREWGACTTLCAQYSAEADKAQCELARAEAAVVTARRDALLSAADDIELRDDGPAINFRAWAAWLRARASTQTPAPPADCCVRRLCGGEWLHLDDCPVYLAMLADPECQPVPAERDAAEDAHTVAAWMTRMHYFRRDWNDTAGRCLCGLPEVNDLHGPEWKPTPSAEEQLAAGRADEAFQERLRTRMVEDKPLLDRMAAGRASTQTPAAPADCDCNDWFTCAECEAAAGSASTQTPPATAEDLAQEICWTSDGVRVCILLTPCPAHGTAVGEGSRVGNLPHPPLRPATDGGTDVG